MDYTDAEIRSVYGDRYAQLTPTCKALLACMLHQDWQMSCEIFAHMHEKARSLLLPMHRDLAVHLCSVALAAEPKFETKWMEDVFRAWQAGDISKGADILRDHDKELDKFSVSWLLCVKNQLLRCEEKRNSRNAHLK
jgi:hypothetical protein